MTKYSAGDEVTIKLDASFAEILNSDYSIIVSASRISSHKPAPKPIVWFQNVYGDGIDCMYPHPTKESADEADRNYEGCIVRSACLKVTYSPATGEATVEKLG